LQFKQSLINVNATVDFQFSKANGDKAELPVDNETRNYNSIQGARSYVTGHSGQWALV
jgi:hypothetical protein